MDLSALQDLLPESWLAIIACLVAVCAAVAVLLPAPKEDSSTVYKAIYRVIQWVALNLGKAKNAQDAKTDPAATETAGQGKA